MSSSGFRILVKNGPTIGQEFLLEKREILLGRDTSNDIVIPDPEVSRRHARLFFSGSTYEIEDVGSTNGTWVDGQRIDTPTALKNGQIISFGDQILLVFEVIDPDATRLSSTARGELRPVAPAAPAVPVSAAAPPAPEPSPTPASGPAPLPQLVFKPIKPPPDAAPVDLYPEEDGEDLPEKKRLPGWAIILIVVLGVFMLACLLPVLILELTNNWCTFFSSVFNSLMPGSCP